MSAQRRIPWWFWLSCVAFWSLWSGVAWWLYSLDPVEDWSEALAQMLSAFLGIVVILGMLRVVRYVVADECWFPWDHDYGEVFPSDAQYGGWPEQFVGQVRCWNCCRRKPGSAQGPSVGPQI